MEDWRVAATNVNAVILSMLWIVADLVGYVYTVLWQTKEHLNNLNILQSAGRSYILARVYNVL